MYHASKWALEGISQALAAEVKDFGIHVTLIEPGGFSTDWGGSSARHSERLDAYTPLHEASEQRRAGNTPGDPTASAEAVMKIVDAGEPPLRAFFGSLPLTIAEKDYEGRLETWREWQPVAELAQGD
jgi:NAD(P)-dependent dehydrogenase (short-subunit alcohol dehydrogenase family)